MIITTIAIIIIPVIIVSNWSESVQTIFFTVTQKYDRNMYTHVRTLRQRGAKMANSL